MKKKSWIWLVAIVFFTSCGNSIPDEIIRPADMENLLYDYHISIGIATNLGSNDNYKREAYKNYVFKKHQVTQAEFDSSMVWYTRHSQELAAIYSNLNKRLHKEKKHIEAKLKEMEIDIMTQAGDTVNIWQFYPIYWLTDTPLNNLMTFDINRDSNFWARDAFLWKGHFTFFEEGKATMGLNIQYTNDSVVGQTKDITQSGEQSIYLYSDSIYKIKSINGFIHVYKDSVHQQPNILISDISLTKYHRSDKDSVVVENKSKATPKKEIKKEDEEEALKPLPKKATRITAPQRRKMEEAKEKE